VPELSGSDRSPPENRPAFSIAEPEPFLIRPFVDHVARLSS